MTKFEYHLDTVDYLLRRIHSHAKAAPTVNDRNFTTIEFDIIGQYAFEAVEALCEARKAAKPWWRRFL